MEEEVKLLMYKYYACLLNTVKVSTVENSWAEITTPFLDRHNDYIHVYVKKNDDNYVITDDFYMLEDLGDKIYDEKIQVILKGFDIYVNDDELVSHATKENFSIRMHFFIQGLLAISHNFSY